MIQKVKLQIRNTQKKLLQKLLLATLIIFLLSACSPRAKIKVTDDDSGTVSFSAQTGTLLQELMKKMQKTAGTPSFDAIAISRSLEGATLEIKKLSFPGPGSIELEADCANLNTLLDPSVSFITITKNGQNTTLRLRVDPKSMQAAVKLLDENTASMLELLMAPIFTGEILTPAQYTDLISLTYGARYGEELASAQITVTIETPKAIKSATGPAEVSTTKNTALFTIPFITFLTDLSTKDYYINW